MAIHEHLPRIPKPQLRGVGWSKATEMAKLGRRDGKAFDCANWLHKANELPILDFKREVRRTICMSTRSSHAVGSATTRCEI